MHCDSVGGTCVDMDECLQTRLEERPYSDVNDVLSFQVMLVGGADPYERRVELFQHGTVCDNWWSYQDAAVVCKMLGYEKGGQAYGSSHFGEGTGEYCGINFNARVKKISC